MCLLLVFGVRFKMRPGANGVESWVNIDHIRRMAGMRSGVGSMVLPFLTSRGATYRLILTRGKGSNILLRTEPVVSSAYCKLVLLYTFQAPLDKHLGDLLNRV